MKLPVVVDALNGLLADIAIEDYKNAINGLQLENTKEIEKVAVAVDACQAEIDEALRRGVQLLIVHHGLFWSSLAPLTGSSYRKIRAAMLGGLAVYSSHLPLDAHPRVGNNALFADMLTPGAVRRPFLRIGCEVEMELGRDDLLDRVRRAVGGRVHLAPGGPPVCHRIGIVTGGAGGDIFQAAAAGVDTFITGEGPHWTYTAAEELGVNLIYAGHYATETFGVKALGRYVEEQFGLPWEFIDHPTGL